MRKIEREKERGKKSEKNINRNARVLRRNSENHSIDIKLSFAGEADIYLECFRYVRFAARLTEWLRVRLLTCDHIECYFPIRWIKFSLILKVSRDHFWPLFLSIHKSIYSIFALQLFDYFKRLADSLNFCSRPADFVLITETPECKYNSYWSVRHKL